MDRPTPFYDLLHHEVLGYDQRFEQAFRKKQIVNRLGKLQVTEAAYAALAYNRMVLWRLEKPGLQRILFDSRQAAEFAGMEETVVDEMLTKLIVPFDSFWLEFTEPIEIGEPDPEHPSEYIPATRKFKAGKIFHPLMDEYMGKGGGAES